MAGGAMVKNFGGKKRPPKFEDEGPPSGDDQGRGSGSGTDDDSAPEMPDDTEMAPDSEGADAAMPGNDSGVGDEEQAADTLADLVGIGPEDRQDFANALKMYVSACLASSMAPPDMGPSPDMGGGGPPEEEV